MLKINTKTVNEVDYNDVDQAITEFLKSKGFDPGRQYDCVCEEEWQNDMKKEWKIEPRLPETYVELSRRQRWDARHTQNVSSVTEPGQSLIGCVQTA